jgi:hypothetical protein
LPWDGKALKFYEYARETMVRSPTFQVVTHPVYDASIDRLGSEFVLIQVHPTSADGNAPWVESMG